MRLSPGSLAGRLETRIANRLVWLMSKGLRVRRAHAVSSSLNTRRLKTQGVNVSVGV